MSQYKKLSSFGEKKEEEKSSDIPNILKIEDKTQLIQSYKVCVVDIYADWCGPCKIVSPLFSQLFKKYYIPGICILAKENVDLKLSTNIQVVPSFQFYLYGQLESIISGADIKLVENKIIELINSNVKIPESLTVPVPNQNQNQNQGVIYPQYAPPPPQLPPQLQQQFQYETPPATTQDASIPSTTQDTIKATTQPESMLPTQTQSEGFQHDHNFRQQYYEKPPQLPIQLPIRRKF